MIQLHMDQIIKTLVNTNSDKSKEQRARGTYQFRSPKGAVYEYTLDNKTLISNLKYVSFSL